MACSLAQWTGHLYDRSFPRRHLRRWLAILAVHGLSMGEIALTDLQTTAVCANNDQVRTALHFAYAALATHSSMLLVGSDLAQGERSMTSVWHLPETCRLSGFASVDCMCIHSLSPSMPQSRWPIRVLVINLPSFRETMQHMLSTTDSGADPSSEPPACISQQQFSL